MEMLWKLKKYAVATTTELQRVQRSQFSLSAHTIHDSNRFFSAALPSSQFTSILGLD